MAELAAATTSGLLHLLGEFEAGERRWFCVQANARLFAACCRLESQEAQEDMAVMHQSELSVRIILTAGHVTNWHAERRGCSDHKITLD